MEQKHTQSSETQKYEKIWDVKEYRRFSPAEKELKDVLAWLDKHAAQHVIDFGCGTGRLSMHLAEAGYSVRMLDIAGNCLDVNVERNLSHSLTFEQACLWSDDVGQMRADAVICIDVLEHIPPEFVPKVIENIKRAAPHGYVNAALYKDGFGQRIGMPLHLTVRPAGWWHEQFADARCSVRGNDAWMIW